jgi:signal transduction histidine kinase
LLVLALSLGLTATSGQTNLPLLTTTRQVHQLDASEAMRGYPVRVRGVITFVSEPLEQLFIEDESGGIFVEIHGDYGFPMQTGQMLEIEGVSAPGGFAPDIKPQRLRSLGKAPLPLPRKVTFDQMAAGQQDCNWVEFNGIVRSARTWPREWAGLDLVGEGGRVIVAIGEADPKSCEQLVDAEVSVRGVCIAQFNANGQLIQVALQTPTLAEVSVIKPAPADPIAVPLRKCSQLLRYAPMEQHGHRVKVQAVVLFQQPGRTLFVADETQGLCVQTPQRTPVRPGDLVEVLGFPAAGEYVSPILQDAVFRNVGLGTPPQPLTIAADDGQRETNHAALVQLDGTVLSRVERLRDTTLQLRSANVVFNAQLDTAAGQNRALASVPEGSRVRLTGICLVPADLSLTSPRTTFTLLLRSPADVTVLERPSWWTARHTFWVLGVTLAVFCASLGWVAVLRNRVKAQTQIIRQKVQREAALEERTRIARDLHDELGSSLTQITLLSDRPKTEANSELSENIRKISATARDMAQSLDEIVWAVNPQHDTLESLVEYFSQTADDFLEGTTIRCRVKTPLHLPLCMVPADVRHQFFLAFKEALNNAVRHAACSELQIEFVADPAQFQVIVADNGIGFDTDSPRSAGCGLKNMRQRLEAMGGQFTLSSRPHQGTVVTLLVPLAAGTGTIAPNSAC